MRAFSQADKPRFAGSGIASGPATADNQRMAFHRSSGVLLHVTSLPSYGGIGDLGPAAHEFVGFLARARQHVWQVLPLGPTGYGNSPYAATSAFAGNPLLISLEFLSDWGWIDGIAHRGPQWPWRAGRFFPRGGAQAPAALRGGGQFPRPWAARFEISQSVAAV